MITYSVALRLCNYSVAVRSVADDSLRVCVCVADGDVCVWIQLLISIQRIFQYVIIVANSM